MMYDITGRFTTSQVYSRSVHSSNGTIAFPIEDTYNVIRALFAAHFSFSFAASNLMYKWGLFLCSNGKLWKNVKRFSCNPCPQVVQEYVVKAPFLDFDFLCTRSLRKKQRMAFFPSFCNTTWHPLDLFSLLTASVRPINTGY